MAHQGSGVGLFRFYAGVHPSRLETARGGGPTWLAVGLCTTTSGSDSSLLPKNRSASGWLARALRMRWCRGAAVACQPSGGVQRGCSHLSRALAVAPVLVRASPEAEKLPSETPGLRCTIDY